MTRRFLTVFAFALSSCAAERLPQSPPTTEDLSSEASFTGWGACPFPEGAKVDRAALTVRVLVSPEGSAVRTVVTSTSAPGEGFEDALLSCVDDVVFRPGCDEDGALTTAWTPLFRVRFVRQANEASL